MIKRRLLLTTVLAAVLIPISVHAEADLKKVVFIPQWVPQAQFAGYYFAAEQGIYRRHGLDVTILSGGPQRLPPLDLLREGKADFATLWLSTGIQARAQGLNLVNIGQVVANVGLLFPEAHLLIDVRILRLLRIIRIFKLTAYFGEYSALATAIAASRRKILIFLSIVLMIVLLMGTLMYVVEGPEHGYTSIPVAIYWAIVTLTTVGYGDIAPKTDIGRLIASVMMLLGWGIIAVPTGIVSSEMTARRFTARPPTTRTCHECLSEGHEPAARYCRDCGAALPPHQSD